MVSYESEHQSTGSKQHFIYLLNLYLFSSLKNKKIISDIKVKGPNIPKDLYCQARYCAELNDFSKIFNNNKNNHTYIVVPVCAKQNKTTLSLPWTTNIRPISPT